MSEHRFEVVPHHYLGPAVIHGGTLTEVCPSVESAHRIANALNEVVYDGDLHWALPRMSELSLAEKERVIRTLAKRIRYA